MEVAMIEKDQTIEVMEAIEQAIQGKECTFSAFVIAAVRAALEDLAE